MNDDIDDRMEAQECEYEMGIEHDSKQWGRITELEAELTTATTKIASLEKRLAEAEALVNHCWKHAGWNCDVNEMDSEMHALFKRIAKIG